MGGVPEEPEGETWQRTEEKVKHLQVEDLDLEQGTVDKLSIERAQRLGRRKANGDRVIKVQFANMKDKEVLKQARTIKTEKPYFREDHTSVSPSGA